MNILFLTIGVLNSIYSEGLYTDLLRCLMKRGNTIYTISAYEKRYGKYTQLIKEDNSYNLHVRTGNITKCNLLEKGISTLMINGQYKRAIKKYFAHKHFDLVLYTTPPITLVDTIKFLKKRNKCKSYLMLKDIFPQNAVDLGIIKKTGIKSFIYKYFRKKEKELYSVSDFIGCMSPANIDYLSKNNSFLDSNKIELFPNSIEIKNVSITSEEKNNVRKKYNLPLDKKIFVYGGNLGRPQNISFVINCIRSQKNNQKAFFLIVGDGTEYEKLLSFQNNEHQENFMLIRKIAREDYDRMIVACDIGMIFLDYRFTIPNYPSRLLSYLQARLPVLACTDVNTDIKDAILEGKFGWWCPSNNVESFGKLVNLICETDLLPLKQNSIDYLEKNFSVQINCTTLEKHL